ncbi:HAD family acid phosphatase [Granulicella cerasi]|uniref:HAD family acid phosphatase n=2 Tax=Granulicella cerasi TaxID=741063 RepID=A0ABW1Z3W0_9BACT
MDIDETTLSGYCEMRREDFHYDGKAFNAWVVSEEASVAIPGAKRLFDEARHLGVTVFFITGRDGATEPGKTVDQTAQTAHNLKLAGFDGYGGLYLRPADMLHGKTIAYKSAMREKIIAQGYRIVMSIGDQWSDLLGAPQATVSVKLPNPMYFIP